jgi:hypothetical protein
MTTKSPLVAFVVATVAIAFSFVCDHVALLLVHALFMVLAGALLGSHLVDFLPLFYGMLAGFPTSILIGSAVAANTAYVRYLHPTVREL